MNRSHYIKPILYISLSLNLVAAGFVAKRFLYQHNESNQKTFNLEAAYYKYRESKTAHFKSTPVKAGSFLFVGTSLTEGFSLDEFGNPAIKNRGIGGNKIREIRDRMPELVAAKPEKIFLEMGTNDFKAKVPLDTMQADYLSILDMIKKGSPATQVYIQSTPPIREGQYGFGEDVANANKSIATWNNWLKHTSQEQGLTYIDIHSALLSDGVIKDEYTWDGIHLTAKGYAVWKAKVDPYIL